MQCPICQKEMTPHLNNNQYDVQCIDCQYSCSILGHMEEIRFDNIIIFTHSNFKKEYTNIIFNERKSEDNPRLMAYDQLIQIPLAVPINYKNPRQTLDDCYRYLSLKAFW